MSWFRKRSEASELEARLRSERPAPRPEFLQAVAARVNSSRPRASFRLRSALAAALTLAMLVAVASFGGVSYAAAGAQQAVKSVSSVFSPPKASSAKTNDDDPDDDQYVKACKDAVKQKTKVEKVLHRAQLKAATTKAERKAENKRHKAKMAALAKEKKECHDEDEDED